MKKKIIAMFAAFMMLLSSCFSFILTVDAAVVNPYYTADSTYDGNMNLYMLNVYVTSESPLVSGNLGLKFNKNVNLDWNDFDREAGYCGYFSLNTYAFNLDYVDEISEKQDVLRDNGDVFVSYTMKEPDAVDKLLLGTIVITDVERDADGNFLDLNGEPFGDDLFSILDYKEIALSESVVPKSDVWRVATHIDKVNAGTNSLIGYYQGVVKDGETYVFTDMYMNVPSFYKSDYVVLKGYVLAYNPNYALTVTAQGNAQGSTDVYEGEVTNLGYYQKGECLYRYVIKLPGNGSYNIKYEKPIHVNCTRTVTVNALDGKFTIPDAVELFAGDMNDDGNIKLPDWSHMKVNARYYGPISSLGGLPTWRLRQDINGDGFIDLLDEAIAEQNEMLTSNDYFKKPSDAGYPFEFKVVCPDSSGHRGWLEYENTISGFYQPSFYDNMRPDKYWQQKVRKRYDDADYIMGIVKLDEAYMTRIGE